MENFKIDIFKSENKNNHFPKFKKIENRECGLYKYKFTAMAGLNDDENDSIKILKTLREKSKLIAGVNADFEDFNFKLLVRTLQIEEPEYVNVNWDSFENIDRFKLEDFSNNLRYIWYPGPDDIEIFPNSLSWIISIDPTGSVYMIQKFENYLTPPAVG